MKANYTTIQARLKISNKFLLVVKKKSGKQMLKQKQYKAIFYHNTFGLDKTTKFR